MSSPWIMPYNYLHNDKILKCYIFKRIESNKSMLSLNFQSFSPTLSLAQGSFIHLKHVFCHWVKPNIFLESYCQGHQLLRESYSYPVNIAFLKWAQLYLSVVFRLGNEGLSQNVYFGKSVGWITIIFNANTWGNGKTQRMVT